MAIDANARFVNVSAKPALTERGSVMGRAGRPKVSDEVRVHTAVRLPISLKARLDWTAQERGVSTNHLLVKAAEKYLDALRQEEQARG